MLGTSGVSVLVPGLMAAPYRSALWLAPITPFLRDRDTKPFLGRSETVEGMLRIGKGAGRLSRGQSLLEIGSVACWPEASKRHGARHLRDPLREAVS